MEAFMRKIITTLFALALAVPMLAVAQSGQMQKQQQQYQNTTQADENQAAAISENGGTTMEPHHITGMVSNDGKNLTSGNTMYAINNPKELQKYNNQKVTAKFEFDTDTNTLHILSVMPAQ
jgi:pyocin large subunit-like protein